MPDREALTRESASDSFEGRLDVLFELVGRAGVNGITVGELVERVPWRADSAEIRAKLMSLRSRECVFYDADAKRWFR